MKLGIYGAGSLGKKIYDVALRINENEQKWDEILFIDDVRQEKEYYLGRVIKMDEARNIGADIESVVGLGTPKHRRNMVATLRENHIALTNIIDPTVIISPTAKINTGVIILPYSSVASDAVIEENVLVQPYIHVAHDVTIGSNSVLSANVSIGGNVQLGNDCYIGMGAVIREKLTIESRSIVGMGAVVLKNVDSGSVVVGNPARVIRKDESGNVFK